MKEKEFDNQGIDNESVVEAIHNGDEHRAKDKSGESADNMSESKEVVDDNTSEVADNQNEWQDKYLRLSAEFDNFRKRTAREKIELRDAGGEEMLRALLPVADDLDRAAQAVKSSEDVEALSEGVLLILKKFFDTLRSKGLCEIHCVGEKLDTDLHEAVAKFPVKEEGKKGKIIDVAQKGYKFNDKVIRHAKVVVGE